MVRFFNVTYTVRTKTIVRELMYEGKPALVKIIIPTRAEVPVVDMTNRPLPKWESFYQWMTWYREDDLPIDPNHELCLRKDLGKPKIRKVKTMSREKFAKWVDRQLKKYFTVPAQKKEQ